MNKPYYYVLFTYYIIIIIIIFFGMFVLVAMCHEGRSSSAPRGGA